MIASTQRPSLIATLLILLIVPVQGFACGGCFNPPGPSLVVQDAERVLFMRDNKTGKTRVWVEVRYSGPAEDFGWVVPLAALPAVGVGTGYVFDRLDQAAAPRFVTTIKSGLENCYFSDSNQSLGCAASRASGLSGSDFALASSAPNEGGDGRAVSVLAKDQVGPYDYEIVQSASPDKLYKWLNDNGYNTPEAAKPVISNHVTKGDVFVAFKLKNNAGVNDIRPVTFEMQDAEPCVPLRLTSIAASDNMAVVVYLLGPGRAVPKNNFHVVVNETKLRWEGGVNNYEQVLAQAIDEAAGHAFATEFAGPSAQVEVRTPDTAISRDITALFANNVVDPNSPLGPVGPTEPDSSSMWAPGQLFDADLFQVAPFAKAKTATDVVNALKQTQLAVSSEVAADLEAATGLAAAAQEPQVQQFWNSIRNGSLKAQAGLSNSVDGVALHKALKDGFVDPVQRVREALAADGNTLTRLNLRIDPAEMDRDPIFGFHPALPEVSNVHHAELVQVCPGGDSTISDMRVSLSSGSWIVPGSKTTNSFGTESITATTAQLNVDPRFIEAPFASKIEVLDEQGDPVPVPQAQIDLVDSALKGAELGKPSLSPDLVLSGPLARWKAPASDPHASLLSGAVAAHMQGSDSGCMQAAKAGKRDLSALVLLLCALSAITWRRLHTQK